MKIFNQFCFFRKFKEGIAFILLLLFFVGSFGLLYHLFGLQTKVERFLGLLEWNVSYFSQSNQSNNFEVIREIGGFSVQMYHFKSRHIVDITIPNISFLTCHKILQQDLSFSADVLINGKKYLSGNKNLCFSGLFVDMTFQVYENLEKHPIFPQCEQSSDCNCGNCFHRFCVPECPYEKNK